MLDPAILRDIDDLQRRYIDALDSRDMQRWLQCFDDHGSYVCISRENADAGLRVALMMDDTRARLVDRVKFVSEVWAGTFEDYVTRHFVQSITATAEDSFVRSRANFLVCFTSERGESGMLVNGVYEDEILLTASGAKFKSKKAVLDTFVTPRYLVYPV